MSRSLLAKCAAEFTGTFALVFAGCGSVPISQLYNLSSFIIPVAFGLVVSSMIYAVGHISGAHFNPAVTLGFWISHHFPKNHIIPYLVFQCAGAFAAVGFLYLLLPQAPGFGATVPSVELWRAFLWEVILSFFLMFVIVSVATDTRAVGMMAGVAIGGTVALCAMLGGPITGASMNPARTLAPNIIQGEWNSIWIYMLAPVLGAVVAAMVYEWIRCDFKLKDENTESAKGCC